MSGDRVFKQPVRGLLYASLATAMLLSWTNVLAAAQPASLTAVKSELLLDGTAHQVLFDIDADAERVFAVGAGGRILRSDDAGRNWVTENSKVKTALLGVSSAGEHTVAVGQMGLILQRQADKSWKKIDSGSQERLFDVSINRAGYGVAVGAFGTLLRTQDGGSHWIDAAPDFKGVFRDNADRLGDFFTPNMYGVQINEDKRVWVVGELALVMRSPNGGKDWQFTHVGGNDDDGIDPTLSGVHVRSNGTGFAVGQEGFLLRTQNSGKHWQALARPSEANLLGVLTTDDGAVVITGMRDMRISRDGGASFIPVRGNAISTGWFHGITTAPGRDDGLAVGVGGKILLISN